MKRQNRPRTMVAVLAVAVAAPVTGAHAQACLGLPLDRQGTGVSLEVASHPDIRLHRAQVGRQLGPSLTGVADLAYAMIRNREWDFHAERRGTGRGAGAIIAYNYEVVEIPFCTFVGVRHGRASVTYEPFFEADAGRFADRVTGSTLLMGVGLGGDGRLSDALFVTLFGNTRAGWAATRFSNHCPAAGGCAYSLNEGLVHVEAETGALLRHGRFFGGGGARLTVSESDPLLRLMSLYGTEPLLWFLSLGVAF